MNNQILEHREDLNNLDKELLSLIEKRLEVCKKIGQIKKENGFDVLDPIREQQIIDSRTAQSNLNPEFTKTLFKEIFKESKRLQNE